MTKPKPVPTIPDATEILDGLTLQDVHPPLADAQDAAAEAEQRLEEARRQLTDEQADVAGKQATGAGVDELADALRRVEAARLIVEQREQELRAAREAVEQETAAAKVALARAADERIERLQALADELAPALRELGSAFRALRAHASRVSDRYVEVGHSQLLWPVPPAAWRYVPSSLNDGEKLPPGAAADLVHSLIG